MNFLKTFKRTKSAKMMLKSYLTTSRLKINTNFRKRRKLADNKKRMILLQKYFCRRAQMMNTMEPLLKKMVIRKQLSLLESSDVF